MAVTNTFSANTLIESAKVNENFDDLATGDGDETENSLRTFRDESFYDHVVSGGIITDPGASLSQTTTALVAVIDGRRVTISATAKTYTASKDTYVDVLRSGTSASYVYTEVSNNAASPALASNSIRLAIVTTNGSEITNVNQGEPDQVIPIASSIPYSVSDSLGNLINPRDVNARILGYSQRATGQGGITSVTDITGMSTTIKTPANCYRLKLSASVTISSATAGTTAELKITDSSNVIQIERSTIIVSSNAAALQFIACETLIDVSPATTYTFKLRALGSATVVINNGDSADKRSVLTVERA